MQRGLSRTFLITDGKRFRRVVNVDQKDIINLPDGRISSKKILELTPGSSFIVNKKRYFIFPCSIYDYIMYGLERKTQIVYPKEAGYILLRLDVSPGKRVGEGGGGSGSLTSIFSRAVGKEGQVYTYEKEDRFYRLIEKNLLTSAEFDNVVLKKKDMEDGIDERDLDAFFVDVKEPWRVIERVYDALKPGGNLGILVPTANQISHLLKKLESTNFFTIEVLEILLREYKLNPDRVRPVDRMVAHTGYLLFARKLIPGEVKV
ncbi:MAG: tRNA (adenine-N1)-methyltransferase [Spirochaetes bacterium]|nr:MAG: tRNA (adenine-N1)-methyltransferase [Spirochaetota bacterium]